MQPGPGHPPTEIPGLQALQPMYSHRIVINTGRYALHVVNDGIQLDGVESTSGRRGAESQAVQRDPLRGVEQCRQSLFGQGPGRIIPMRTADLESLAHGHIGRPARFRQGYVLCIRIGLVRRRALTPAGYRKIQPVTGHAPPVVELSYVRCITG